MVYEIFSVDFKDTVDLNLHVSRNANKRCLSFVFMLTLHVTSLGVLRSSGIDVGIRRRRAEVPLRSSAPALNFTI